MFDLSGKCALVTGATGGIGGAIAQKFVAQGARVIVAGSTLERAEAAAERIGAHKALAAQFADHGRTGPLEREYVALVWGVPSRTYGTVDAPIGRSPANREKMAVVPIAKGREAITHWEVAQAYDGPEGAPVATKVRCALETGRTHQIRVHMAHIGHPLLGDGLYAKGFKTKAARLSEEARGALEALDRQALHAAVLGFAHPRTGETMRFERDPPPDMARLLAALEGG